LIFAKREQSLYFDIGKILKPEQKQRRMCFSSRNRDHLISIPKRHEKWKKEVEFKYKLQKN